METKVFTPKEVEAWQLPPCQRPLRINERVRCLAEEIKCDGGVVEGVITLGKVGKDPAIYIVDGQHRLEAFKISGLGEALADFRLCNFDTMGELAEEYVRLNSALVRMRPDDILRGLEAYTPSLKAIREACDFVGYDYIRRGNRGSAMVSMSALLRCWHASAQETPNSGQGMSAQSIAETLEPLGVQQLVAFMAIVHAAWGREPENYRLWGNLNLTVCMWIYRRLVLQEVPLSSSRRTMRLNVNQFKQCMMSLAASADYIDWLLGRQLGERDRGPCYSRVKAIMARRIQDEKGGMKVVLLQPAWSSK